LPSGIFASTVSNTCKPQVPWHHNITIDTGTYVVIMSLVIPVLTIHVLEGCDVATTWLLTFNLAFTYMQSS